MKKLVLLRHGQSTWNQENRFTGWTDVDLTDQGVREAEQSARLLLEGGYRFDAAYTSVLKRAIRTFLRTRSITTAVFVYGMNKGWKRLAKIQAPRDAERYGFTPKPSRRLDKIVDAYRMHLSPA